MQKDNPHEPQQRPNPKRREYPNRGRPHPSYVNQRRQNKFTAAVFLSIGTCALLGMIGYQVFRTGADSNEQGALPAYLTKPQKNGFANTPLISLEEVIQLQKNHQHLADNHQNVRRQLQETQDELDELKRSVFSRQGSHRDSEVHKLHAKVNQKNQTNAYLKGKVNALQKELDKVSKQVHAKEATIASLNEMIAYQKQQREVVPVKEEAPAPAPVPVTVLTTNPELEEKVNSLLASSLNQMQHTLEKGRNHTEMEGKIAEMQQQITAYEELVASYDLAQNPEFTTDQVAALQETIDKQHQIIRQLQAEKETLEENLFAQDRSEEIGALTRQIEQLGFQITALHERTLIDRVIDQIEGQATLLQTQHDQVARLSHVESDNTYLLEQLQNALKDNEQVQRELENALEDCVELEKALQSQRVYAQNLAGHNQMLTMHTGTLKQQIHEESSIHQVMHAMQKTSQNSLKDEIETLQEMCQQLEEQIIAKSESNHESLHRLEMQLAYLSQENEALIAQLKEQTDQTRHWNALHQAGEDNHATLEREHQTLKQNMEMATANFEEQLDTKQSALAEAEELSQHLQEMVDSLQSQLESNTARMDEYEEKISLAKEERDALRQQWEQEVYEQIESLKEEHTNTVADLNERVRTLHQQHDEELTGTHRNHEEATKQLQDQIAQLVQEREEFSDRFSQEYAEQLQSVEEKQRRDREGFDEKLEMTEHEHAQRVAALEEEYRTEIQRRIQETEQQLAALQDEHTSLFESYSQESDRRIRMEQQATELQERLNDSLDAYNGIRSEFESIQAAYEAADVRWRTLQVELQEELQKERQEAEHLKGTIEALESEMALSQSRIAEYEEVILNQVKNHDRLRESSENDVAELLQSLGTQEDIAMNLQNELENSKQQIQYHEQERERLMSEWEQERKELYRRQEQLDVELQDQIQQHKSLESDFEQYMNQEN